MKHLIRYPLAGRPTYRIFFVTLMLILLPACGGGSSSAPSDEVAQPTTHPSNPATFSTLDIEREFAASGIALDKGPEYEIDEKIEPILGDIELPITAIYVSASEADTHPQLQIFLFKDVATADSYVVGSRELGVSLVESNSAQIVLQRGSVVVSYTKGSEPVQLEQVRGALSKLR